MSLVNCLWLSLVLVIPRETAMADYFIVIVGNKTAVNVSSNAHSAILPCEYRFNTHHHGNVRVNVRWSLGDRNGPNVITKETDGSFVVGALFKGRVSMITKKFKSSLVLYYPKYNDSGNYTCVAIAVTDQNQADSQTIFLNVVKEIAHGCTCSAPIAIACVSSILLACVSLALYYCIRRKGSP